ncbi:MAG: O-methyltransferase [Butyribacter sp.]|nr:O-methyltransferase [bacterium]MDY3854271.1 O-methyltransferase [Butyribacter sp.]
MIIDERTITYIDSLNWQIPEYLKEVEKKALEDEVPVIRRSMQSLLCFVLKLRKPKAILEIGTAVGFSGMLMSEYAAKNCQIDTIENYPVRQKEAQENFEKYHKTEQIHLYKADAQDVLKQFVEEGRKYDFIFMDAAKGQYMNFLPAILALLSENGMLVTDNVLQDGDIIQSRYAITKRNRTIHSRMREYLYTLTHSDELDTLILPVGDGVTLSTFRDREK